jgi:hypothetical protein
MKIMKIISGNRKYRQRNGNGIGENQRQRRHQWLAESGICGGGEIMAAAAAAGGGMAAKAGGNGNGMVAAWQRQRISWQSAKMAKTSAAMA